MIVNVGSELQKWVLDQVLSRFRVTHDEGHLSVRCFLVYLTLLASPESAGGDLGRAPVVPLRGVLFSLFTRMMFRHLRCVLVRVDT